MYGDQYNLAPRKEFISRIYNSMHSEGYSNGKVLLIDTERDKEIYLGTAYPFPKLGLGECLINEDLAASKDFVLNQNISVLFFLDYTV